MSAESSGAVAKRFFVVVILGVAFAYIEAAVVDYLRVIFHSGGFNFPLTEFGTDPLWKRLLLTEVGREAATVVLILAAAWLSGRGQAERFAYFLTIFAIWDIFYYVWLKVLLDWPDSIMDWDILFLIPRAWASPVLAPVLVSVMLLVFAVVILYCYCTGKPLRATLIEWSGFCVAGIIVVISFCIAGLYSARDDFESHFYWPVFAVGQILAIVLFFRCLLRSRRRGRIECSR